MPIWFYGILLAAAIISVSVVADAIDGSGTVNWVAKFVNNTTIANSSIYDDGSLVNITVPLYENGSRVCTAANGYCGGASDQSYHEVHLDGDENETFYNNLTSGGSGSYEMDFTY